MTDSSSSKPSYQPTSRPSELWVAPSVPADITSDLLTSQPTNNAVGTLPLSVKDTIKLDDESTLAWDHYVFIGIIVAVIVLLIVYFNRRSISQSSSKGKYELVSVREVDEGN